MNRKPIVAAICLAGLVLAAASAPTTQGTPPQPRYRVVVTPPFDASDWNRKDPFVEHEPLTTALGVLDQQGFDPVLMQAVLDDLRFEKGEYRMVVVARRR